MWDYGQCWAENGKPECGYLETTGWKIFFWNAQPFLYGHIPLGNFVDQS